MKESWRHLFLVHTVQCIPDTFLAHLMTKPFFLKNLIFNQYLFYCYLCTFFTLKKQQFPLFICIYYGCGFMYSPSCLYCRLGFRVHNSVFSSEISQELVCPTTDFFFGLLISLKIKVIALTLCHIDINIFLSHNVKYFHV